MNRMIRRLLTRHVDNKNTHIWRRVDNDREFYYEAVIDGQKAKLTVNDFPDEPLFSVIVDDQKHDYEYLPRNWQLDRPLRAKTSVKPSLPDDPMFWEFLPPNWKAPKDWDK
jgi:hypothetical protein